MRALSVLLTLALASPALAVDRDPWWAPDKALHFGAGAALSAFGYKVAADGTRDRRVRLIVGAAVALTVGAAKEFYDLAGSGTPSWKDFTWDAIGCVAGLAIALAIDWAVEHFSQSGSSGGGARLNFFGPVSSP